VHQEEKGDLLKDLWGDEPENGKDNEKSFDKVFYKQKRDDDEPRIVDNCRKNNFII
jgi:hypothetical protein